MVGRKDNKGPEKVGMGVEVKGSGKDANPWNIWLLEQVWNHMINISIIKAREVTAFISQLLQPPRKVLTSLFLPHFNFEFW